MSPVAFAASGLPPRYTTKHKELYAKKQGYFQILGAQFVE